jgi:broad specificity phosphatase PhoE
MRDEAEHKRDSEAVGFGERRCRDAEGVTLELVYETHSTTVDNELGVATGWLPGELSEQGREQARALGGRRRDDGIAAVYTSDLRRAVETAEIAFDGSRIPVHHDARLRECDYGELNGASVERVAAVRRRHVDEPFPGGESYRQVVERTRAFLADVVAVHDGERIVVIAHSANRWALDHLVEGMPLEEVVDAPFAWQEGWVYLVNASSSSSDIE